MIYIIEGVDGSGKTTLARQLSAQTNTKILHMSNPKTTAEMLGMYDMYEKTLRANKNLILDRAWYSEMAYGPVLRDRSQIDWPQMYELERQAVKSRRWYDNTLYWDRDQRCGQGHSAAVRIL